MTHTDQGSIKKQSLWPTHLLTKLAKPTLATVCLRKRVSRLLDDARRLPTVWVSAPAGAGKTTAIASYLDSNDLSAIWYQVDASDNDIASFFYHMSLAVQPSVASGRPLPQFTAEYFTNHATFAAIYFRELFAQLPHSSVLVFDNLQELQKGGGNGVDSALHEILLLGLMQAPVGTTMIFLSREEPPPAFARLRAAQQMALLNWDELKLTEAESIEIIEARCAGHPDARDSAVRLHRKTQGWVAGLLLLSEQYIGECVPDGIAQNEGAVGEALWKFETQLIFDYLGHEIFRRASRAEQEFLLTTALLPTVDVESAQTLACCEDHDPILERFARRNFFTLRHGNGVYEYHPLFRAFLLSRGKQHFSGERLHELRLQVAQLLAQRGDLEAGIKLLLQMDQWQGAFDLMLGCARKLIDQGRVQTLSNWLQALPEIFRDSHPRVLYWLGLCKMHVSATAARKLLEEALSQFERTDDSDLVVQSWCAIVDSMVVEWNDFVGLRQWLSRYRTLTENRSPPSPAVAASSVGAYMSGLLWAKPDDPDLRQYVEQTEAIFRRETDHEARFVLAVKRLLPYHWWAGDLGKFKTICAEISAYQPGSSAEPVKRVLWCLARAQIEAITGGSESSLDAVAEGLAVGDSAGVHMLDVQLCREAIFAHISTGEVGAARRMLDRMSISLNVEVRKSYFHQFNALVLIHEGEGVRAVEEAYRALELSNHYIGQMSATICLAASLIQVRDLDTALVRLDEARLMSERMGSEVYVATCNFFQAQIHRLRGERTNALMCLGEFLAFSRKYGVVVPGYASRSDAADLLSFGLAANFRVADIKDLITRSRLSPPASDVGINWPWPVVILALGKMQVLLNGTPLVFNVKAQKKPLELLSALVAQGGRDVGMNKLAQFLWPDTEGDIARTNLRTTLLRLRRLIGDSSVTQQGSCLSLNSRICWLDVWALERVCDARVGNEDTVQRMNDLFSLYQGAFLPDNDEPWVMNQRERLRTKTLRLILDIGKQFELDGRGSAAVDVYQKGIEVDPLAEEVYRRLMSCYFRAHRAAEALVLYQRYRTLLNRSFQIEPAAETKSLFREIQRQAM